MVFHGLPCALGEEGLDGFLTGMTERGIAQVVRQAGGTDDGADFLKQGVLQLWSLLDDAPGDVVAQRHADTCHL